MIKRISLITIGVLVLSVMYGSLVPIEIPIALVSTVAIFVLVVGSIIGGIAWEVRKDMKREEEREKAALAAKAAWLAEENLKPKYCVRFIGKDGLARCSETCQPVYSGVHRPRTWTSKEHAQHLLEESYKRGWFESEGGRTIPVAEIYSAEVTLV